jgi:glutaminyl-tRNA synthetase
MLHAASLETMDQDFHVSGQQLRHFLVRLNRMAPALAPEEVIELIRYFTSCGLNSNRSVELCKNVKVAIAAQSLFRLNQLERASLSEKQALILLQLSKDGGKVGEEERNYVVKAIVDERIKSPEQVPGSFRRL